MASALGALLLVLGAFELGLRHYYRLAIDRDPDFGEIMRPGEVVFRLEGSGVSRWGARGLRGELPAPGLRRVLVLGDSFTEAKMIDDGDTFVDHASRSLRQAGKPLALLNAGKASHSLADYVQLAPSYRSVFAPDWVVVELGDSDLAADSWSPTKTHFARAADGSLTTVVVPPKPHVGLSGLLWELRQRSSLVGYAVVRSGQFLEAARREPPLFRAGSAPPPPPPAATDFPVEEELAALQLAYDRRLTLLYLASPSIAPTPLEQRLERACQQLGLPLIQTRAVLTELERRGESGYGFANTAYGTGHLNATGHRVVGAELGRALGEASLP